MIGKTAFVAVSSTILLSLAACGGGGGSGDTPPNNNARASQTASPPTPASSTSAASACYLLDGVTCVVNDDVITRSTIFQGDQRELKALFAKMKQGGHYVIGFEGGSITVGEKGWPDISKTYAGMVFLWFESTFPKSTFDMRNDAVSGTPSSAGAARYPTFAAQYKPDLMIVEFAVNDNYLAKQDIGPVEVDYGKLLDEVIASGAIPVALETVLPTCANAQDAHYPVYASRNLPIMISEKESLCPWTIPQADWNADGTHPNYFGHQILAQLVTRNFDKLFTTN